MTALFRTRRRAEQFDALLEGGRLDDVDRQNAELLELVGALRSVPAVEPRAEFVADLRERLMVAAETELTPAPRRERDLARLTITPRKARHERRVGIALGAVALVGAGTSMAVASQGAIPGDALYPLKRAIENTQTGFSVGDDAKGKTILDNASGRLDEVEELTSRSDADPALVTQTLDTFSDQFSEAGDLLIADYQENGNTDSIAELHASSTESLEALADLEAVVPASAHDALLNAAQTVFALDAAAVQVCPQCGEGLTDVPAQLLASAATDGDASETLAGGELAGTVAGSADTSDERPQNGGKDNGRPSGLNPPESPVSIPSASASPSEGAADDLDEVLPVGPSGSAQGGQQNGQHGGGGKGDKDKPTDLDPVTGAVTETVNEVVNGVVEGVDGLLNGLSGNQPGSKH